MLSAWCFQGGAYRQEVLDVEGFTGQGVGAQQSRPPARPRWHRGRAPGGSRCAIEGEALRAGNAARLVEGLRGGERHLSRRLSGGVRYRRHRGLERRRRPQVEGEAQAVEAGPEVGRRGGDA